MTKRNEQHTSSLYTDALDKY